MKEWATMAEAAELFDCTAQNISNHIRRNNIPTKRLPVTVTVEKRIRAVHVHVPTLKRYMRERSGDD